MDEEKIVKTQETKAMNEMSIQEIYDKCVQFHGHRCPGLAIGVRAAVEALRLLSADRSSDEELVCVTENDACGVDGIQVVMGCSAGKGNLIFRMTGKHAYTFYNRKNQKKVRLVLKKLPQAEDREAKQNYILTAPFDEVFSVTPTRSALPAKASLYASIDCELCGESTAEPFVRLKDGKKVCTDCYRDLAKKASGDASQKQKKLVLVLNKNGEKNGNRAH